MSATINVDLPISVQATANNIVVVGFDVHLDPSGTSGNVNWPYTSAANGDAPAGAVAITIFADTVTVHSDLVNIGQDISIFAREIIVNPGVIINVSAADTWVANPMINNYTIFDGAPNPSQNGANGGNGCNAGTLTLAAQQFSALTPAPASQSDLARLSNTGQLVESLFAGIWAESTLLAKFENIPIEDLSYVFPTYDFSFTFWGKTYDLYFALGIEFTGNTLSGVQNCSSITRSIDPSDNSITIDLEFGPVQLASQDMVVTLDGNAVDATIACTFVLGISLKFTLGSDGITLSLSSLTGPSIQDVNLVLRCERLYGGRPFSLGPFFTGPIGTRLTNIIAPAFQNLLPVLGNAFSAAYSAARAVGGTLLTMANGGVGGRGQDGGLGAPGENGGDGGSSGNGGDGGVINVYAGSLPTSFLLAIAAAGFGELTALPGNGGDGSNGNGVPGSAGTPGQNGKAGAITLNGSAYSYQETPPPLDYSAFAGQLSVGQLLLEEQGAKLAFISADVPGDDVQTLANYNAVIPLYQWLDAVTAPYLTGNPGNRSPQALATLQGINDAATTALSRLVAGLSYYGTPLTWTPAMSATAWDDEINDLLQYGDILSTQYANALTAQKDNQAQINAVNNSSATVNAQVSAIDSQVASLQGSVTTLSASIEQMSSQIDAQVSKITNEIDADAQAYLESIGSGCSLSDLFEVLKGIYSVVSGVAKAEEDIVGAATSIGKGLQDIFDANKDAIANLQTAEANVASLQAAWAALENDLGDNASAGAIAIDGDAFDTLVNQTFSGYSFTAQLLADMQALVVLGQHRNIARTTLTIQVTTILKLNAEKAELENYLEYVQAMTAASVVPVEPEYVQFLANSYNYAANGIVDVMWEMNQALQYQTVAPSALQIDAIDIATLSAKQTALRTLLGSVINKQASSFTTFTDVTYSIPLAAGSAASSQLAVSKRLVFSVPSSANELLFNGGGSTTLTSVSVNLDGLTAANAGSTVNIGIGQLGPDSRYNVTADTWMSFSHAPVTTEYQYNVSTGAAQFTGSFASGADYNGVSPFAYWVLDFNSDLNDWIDWSQVQSITLGFAGSLQPKAEPLKRNEA